MRENMHLNISLSDLCREADAMERTLREGFVELYGLSPMRYLKTLRLHRARVQLQNDRCDRRISDIALRCGFTHFGRFSVDYCSAFGESPSETRTS